MRTYATLRRMCDNYALRDVRDARMIAEKIYPYPPDGSYEYNG